MSKATLEFNLEEPYERLEFQRTINATNAYIVLHKIANEIFRPHRKHGYPDKSIQDLIENCPTYIGEDGFETNRTLEVISKLETMFYNIMEESNVNLDDLE